MDATRQIKQSESPPDIGVKMLAYDGSTRYQHPFNAIPTFVPTIFWDGGGLHKTVRAGRQRGKREIKPNIA
jgi:hypothetical protein